jgi:SAM-dependent methyltransferase
MAMNIAAEPNRKFLQTAEPHATDDWDTLLMHQVDFAFAQELEFLLTLDTWREAAKILDVGCGNGYYISKLQCFFPSKQYSGVDISPELIARATNRYRTIHLSLADITSYAPRGRFDIILMRFFVQHLKDFAGIIDAADRLLEPNGRLMIIETDLARSKNYPALPIFTDMLMTYARVSFAHGSVKQRLLDNAGQLLAAAGADWSVEREEFVTCPQIGPFFKSKLFAIYRLWVDLCDRSGIFAFDFDSVRSELRTWALCDASFSSVALRIIIMRPHR